MYHPILRWFLPAILIAAIVIVWIDHGRRATASRNHPHHPVHHGRTHFMVAGIIAILLIVSFVGSFLIP